MKRYVDKLQKKEKIYYLFRSISHVMGDKMSDEPKSNTTFIKYALQYLGRKWKPSDFDSIKDITIGEIIDMFEDEKYKNNETII